MTWGIFERAALPVKRDLFDAAVEARVDDHKISKPGFVGELGSSKLATDFVVKFCHRGVVVRFCEL